MLGNPSYYVPGMSQRLSRVGSFCQACTYGSKAFRAATHLEYVVVQLRMSAHPHGHTIFPATFEDVL